MKLLIKLLLIIMSLSSVACKTVYKPVYIRAEIPEPERIPYENPVYKDAELDGEVVYYLDIENSKLELKKRSAIDTYIELLENAIKVNNERAEKEKENYKKMSGEKDTDDVADDE